MPSAPPHGERLAEGLWRWTAPHPDWRPAKPGSTGAWDRDVGCVAYATRAAFVFVDPLVSDDAFWDWADAAIAGRPVHVHTTISWHRRSRDPVVERYGATRSGARGDVPAGVAKVPVRRYAETMLWLAQPRALVCGDALLGTGDGGVHICPESWIRGFGRDRSIDELREVLREGTADLDVAMLLPSHGEPVRSDARAALRRALA